MVKCYLIDQEPSEDTEPVNIKNIKPRNSQKGDFLIKHTIINSRFIIYYLLIIYNQNYDVTFIIFMFTASLTVIKL